MKASILILSLFLVGCGKAPGTSMAVSVVTSACEEQVLKAHGSKPEVYHLESCRPFNDTPCTAYDYPTKTVWVDAACTVVVESAEDIIGDDGMDINPMVQE